MRRSSVRGKPQQPGNDSLIGAVALARLGKGAVEGDLSRADLVAQDAAGHIAQPGSPGGVGTGRPDHPGADDIKKLVGTHRSHLSFFQKNSERAGVCGTVRWFAFDSGAQGCSVGRLFRRFFLSRCFLGDQLDATVLIQDIGTQHRERHDRQDNKALFAGQAVKVVDH